MTINLNDIIELKKIIAEKYNIKLHLHDTCSGQYFTLEAKPDNIEDFINKFLAGKKLKANFSSDGLSFYINKNHT